jgi:hypothetical protein
LQHLEKRDAGVFKYSANLYGELLTALATLLKAMTNFALGMLLRRLGTDTRQVIHAAIDYTAMGAGNSVSPNDALKVLKSLGFIVEMGTR